MLKKQNGDSRKMSNMDIPKIFKSKIENYGSEACSEDEIFINLNNINKCDIQKFLSNLSGTEIHLSSGLQELKFNRDHGPSDSLSFSSLEENTFISNSKSQSTYTLNVKLDGDISNECNIQILSSKPLRLVDKIVTKNPGSRRPIMGRNALISKYNKKMNSLDDSQIIRELVTERFSDILDSYLQKSTNRHHLSIFKSSDDEPTFDENLIKHSSTMEDISRQIDFINYTTRSIDRYIYKTTSSSYSDSSEDSMTKIETQSIPSNINSVEDIGSINSDSFEEDEAKITCIQEPFNYVDSQNKVDYSIGTSNISTLVSIVDSANVINTTHFISDFTEEVSESQLMKERIHNLNLECNIQNQIMIQTSKALIYCKSVKEFVSSLEEVEAHRILLISTIKRDLINDEINRLVSEESLVEEDSTYGNVKISDICVSLQNNRQNRKSKEYCQWFVVVLFSGYEVFSTKAVQVIANESLLFRESFNFDHLPANFEINIEIFSMTLKNNLRNYSHESKYHLNKSKQSLCLSPQNLLKGRRKAKKVITVESFQTSMFKLVGKSVVTINNVKNDGRFKLINTTNIKEVMNLNLESNVILNESYSGFLNVGTEGKSVMIWSRRWCRLEGSQFLSYNYPEQREPVLNVDLSFCVNAAITLADRNICARPRTLLIETLEQHSGCVRRHFLSADNMEYMKRWEIKLNNILIALRNWKSMNC